MTLFFTMNLGTAWGAGAAGATSNAHMLPLMGVGQWLLWVPVGYGIFS